MKTLLTCYAKTAINLAKLTSDEVELGKANSFCMKIEELSESECKRMHKDIRGELMGMILSYHIFCQKYGSERTKNEVKGLIVDLYREIGKVLDSNTKVSESC